MSNPPGHSPFTSDSPTWNPDLPTNPPADTGSTEPEDAATREVRPSPALLAADPEPEMEPAPGTVLRGERYSFRLRHPVGSGGMGTVYLAETLEALPGHNSDSSSDLESRAHPPAEVAVKFVRAPEGLDPGSLLKRELSAVRALRHPCIPQVYDWRASPPLLFAAFHYYPSGSLADEIKRLGWLEPPAIWRLLENLLEALTAAHRACILHLDVKPGNVLCDGGGGYVLSDFGISQGRLVSRSVVATGLGAPMFQSPEQRVGDHESFDARTDLWGVGMTAWVALTGISMSDLRDLRAACYGGSHGLPPPSHFRPGIPSRLDRIIMPLLAADQEKRPGAAAEVLAAVRAEIGGTEVPSARLPLNETDLAARRMLYESLMDPLWRSLFRAGNLDSHLALYRPGQEISREDAEHYETYVLLRGVVQITRKERLLATESREGTFLGEVTALTGMRRTATMRAQTEVWAAAFNPAELERFVTRHPAVAIRLIKVLADRVARESQRSTGPVTTGGNS